jgi:hypothetical protein
MTAGGLADVGDMGVGAWGKKKICGRRRKKLDTSTRVLTPEASNRTTRTECGKKRKLNGSLMGLLT